MADGEGRDCASAGNRWQALTGLVLVHGLAVSACAWVGGPPELPFEVVDVKAGERHTCLLTSTGGVKCWGNNHDGQLGDGKAEDRSVPVDVVGLSGGVQSLAAGWRHNCAVTAEGLVRCWGNNHDGQLGDGTKADRRSAQQVVGLMTRVRAVTTGERHTCAVTVSGGVRCWGNNHDGELGDGTRTDRVTPVDVVGLTSGVTAIAAGWRHTCALTTDGRVKCWGNNHDGQLGDGTTVDRMTPVEVMGLGGGVKAIAARWRHTCALTAAGGVKCWGGNHHGELGDETRHDRGTPGDVVGLTSGVKAVATGWRHVCALMTTGTIKCWGNNHEGQLGDGTGIDRNKPVDVIGVPSGVIAIAAGGEHSCAVTQRIVTCWGENEDGQLGDGTFRSTLARKEEPGL